MSHDIRRVGGAGIHTVEGNLAGSHAAHYAKEREKERQLYESKKAQIKADNSTFKDMNSKFSTGSDHMDDEFRRKTVGLVTAHQFRELREAMITAKEGNSSEATSKSAEIAKLKRKKQLLSLSFGEDDHEEAIPSKKIGKDPRVDTSFLADRDREELQRRELESQAADHLKQSSVEKKEDFELHYSFWDGTGLRKQLPLKKGSTIDALLSSCRQQLLHEVPELRAVSPSSLLLVIEGKIIPHHLTLYDLIAARSSKDARIPLISLGRHNPGDDHPIRVVERRWLDRNKHIYPFSVWEELSLSRIRR